MKRVPFGSIKSSFLKDCTKDVTLCHLSSCSSKTLQRSMYCSGEYSKYTVQVKIQLQTDNKLNVQLLGYPPIYEANRTVECQTNPSNTKHHKIQNQGKKEMGLHPVSPLSFCTSSGSPTLERFLPFFLPTTHPIPSYNTFTFFIQHSDVKKKSPFIQHSDPENQWKHLTICIFRHMIS